jgi:hypothetical protein
MSAFPWNVEDAVTGLSSLWGLSVEDTHRSLLSNLRLLTADITGAASVAAP